MKQYIATLFFAFTISASLYAVDFQLQNIHVGGTGCPSEQTQIILDPDASAASLLFSHFESRVPSTEIGPKVQKNISILNCNIFLEIKISSGVKLDSMEISYDMRGFTALDKGVLGSFKSYLVSRSGMGTESQNRNQELLAEKSWSNSIINQQEDFTVRASKNLSMPSQCGHGSNSDIIAIRLQNTLATQILAGFETQSQGSIVVDTSDIKGGLKIRALTSPCTGRAPDHSDTGGKNCKIIRINGKLQQICT